MAQKKATVYILNVSESMTHYPTDAFQKALDCVTCSLENKVLSGRKTDLASVILAGTIKTENEMAEEAPGQYQHISVVCPLQQANLDLLRKLKSLKPSNDPSKRADVLDAVIIAVQMIAVHCKKLKYEKCIALFSDAKDPIDWQDFGSVFGALRENGIVLLVNGVDYDKRQEVTVKENYACWENLTQSTTEGRVCGVDEMYADVHRLGIKEIRPTAGFRGFLYIGNPTDESYLSISVNMFLRVKEVKFPVKSHKYSLLSKGPTHGVRCETTHTIVQATSDATDTFEKRVDQEELERAYRFGKDMVKVAPEEEEYSKLKTKKGMWISRFVPKSSFPRYYLKSHPYVVAAGTHRPTESGVAISAFAHAIYETDTVAIVRYIYKDDGAPKLGALFPCFEEDIELLQFVEIPFAEDIRKVSFPSSPVKDNPKGDAEMEELIDLMDLNKLTDNEGNKYLDPNSTFNPVYWRMTQAIKDRAMDKASPLPKMLKEFNPQFALADIFSKPLDNLSERLISDFEIEKVDKPKKVKEDQGVVQLAPIDQLILQNKLANIQQPLQKLDISINTPVEDFKRMVSRTDSDLVSQAVEKMGSVITTLVAQSFGNSNYRKVIGCLEVMKKTAAEKEKAKQFNNVLYQLKEMCVHSNQTPHLSEFWKLLKESSMSIITKDESRDADVQHLTQEDSVKFFEEQTDEPMDAIPSNEELADDDFDVEDLLAQMDY